MLILLKTHPKELQTDISYHLTGRYPEATNLFENAPATNDAVVVRRRIAANKLQETVNDEPQVLASVPSLQKVDQDFRFDQMKQARSEAHTEILLVVEQSPASGSTFYGAQYHLERFSSYSWLVKIFAKGTVHKGFVRMTS